MTDEPVLRYSQFKPSIEEVFDLAPVGSWAPTKHRFDKISILAVQAALAAERPLLITGDPGVGKSQLARAAAHVLNVPFLYYVVNARSEHTDLLYHYDAVSRLAEAQVLRHGDTAGDWKEDLKVANFVSPGVLWWAFDWQYARLQAKRSCRNADCKSIAGCCSACGEFEHPDEGVGEFQWQPGKGCVVLVDEIDKADTDMPNGLLESFGNHGFQVPGVSPAVARKPEHTAPLLVITTNKERELPAAFVRRCLVLKMEIPGDTVEQRKRFLMRRGEDHCGSWITDKEVYSLAADDLFNDRLEAKKAHALVKPGVAEYLDLLYALSRLCPNDSSRQIQKIEELREFIFRKDPGGPEW